MGGTTAASGLNALGPISRHHRKRRWGVRKEAEGPVRWSGANRALGGPQRGEREG